MKNRKEINNNQEIKMLTVQEIQEIFKIGKRQAYTLVNLEGFPCIRLGNKLLVPQTELKKWIELQCGRTVNW